MQKILIFSNKSYKINLLTTLFVEQIEANKYEYFIAKNNDKEAEYLPDLERKLNQSDYLILLLNPQSITCEMVTETVRRAREFQNIHPNNKPWILPVLIDTSVDLTWDYNLYAYLNKMPQWELKSEENIQDLVAEIMLLIGNELSPSIPETKSRLILNNSLNINEYNKKPLPSSLPKLPKNQDDYHHNFYIKRSPLEENCYQEITKPGALIRIKAPRQMGKTSLMARVLHDVEKLGYKTAVLNFQLVERQIFDNLDIFLRWFSAEVASELNLPTNLDNYWNEIFGSKVSCKSYFERHILKSINTPIVLVLDEVDNIFQYPEITVDFFSLLRAWHEDAKNRDLWKNMRLVVVHSTESYVPIDINQSPFNVGLPIDLPELNAAQIKNLASYYQLQLNISEIEKLMAIVGGNPYLIKLALYEIYQNNISIDDLLKTAATDVGCYADHLQRHWWHLQQSPELAQAAKTVMNSNQPVQLETMEGLKLHSIGLVNFQENQATPRYDLYHLYFRNCL
ncbi:MAG: molecular chaperone Tir [Okeania sp. SIO4D6]|uniref:AAA-like domain-containing protein n=1 Tax=unclassified Okeania TaxID=2634635 RepID=UPI0013BB9807|nr:MULTISPECIES: AAA-like domain-containing protein [unclassified Okeania]NEP05461.1 molecular chaperone Tir [Okeania sp. SIO4D6]NEP74321.1 molecular chaperone Tir [Okeania sp. SIO2G5]NEP96743.1 molecular chaperone Tir [Okeania sp. SIO2F5]